MSSAAPSAGVPSEGQPATVEADARPADSPTPAVLDSPEIERSALASGLDAIPNEDFLPPSAEADQKAPARDTAGRFKGSSPSLPAPPTPDGVEAVKSAPQKFKFAGEEYDSQEAAEQNLRSLRGQFKGLTEKASERDSAAHSARAWKAEYDRLAGELAALKQSGPANPDPTPQPGKGEGIDWDLYAEIRRLANEAGEPWKAEKWLTEETAKVAEARFQRMLDEATESTREREAAEQLAAQTAELFNGLTGLALSDGSPAYPELADPRTAYEVGKTAKQYNMDPDYVLTPAGAAAATLLYRALKGTAPKTSSAPKPAAPTPHPALDADAIVDDGRPEPIGGEPSTPAQRLHAALDRAARPDPVLGFAR